MSEIFTCSIRLNGPQKDVEKVKAAIEKALAGSEVTLKLGAVSKGRGEDYYKSYGTVAFAENPKLEEYFRALNSVHVGHEEYMRGRIEAPELNRRYLKYQALAMEVGRPVIPPGEMAEADYHRLEPMLGGEAGALDVFS